MDIHYCRSSPGDAAAAAVGEIHGTRSRTTLCGLGVQGPRLQTGGLPAPLAHRSGPCCSPLALLLGGDSARSPPGSGSNLWEASVLAMPTLPQPWTPSPTSKAPSVPPQSRFSSGYTSHSQESSGELWGKAVPLMAITQERGLTHSYSPNPQILFSPFIPERKKGDAAGPSFSAAAAGLTRDDFTPLKGLCEAVHLLLGEQQVKVVLGERESEVSGQTGQRQTRSPGSRGMGTFPPKETPGPPIPAPTHS